MLKIETALPQTVVKIVKFCTRSVLIFAATLVTFCWLNSLHWWFQERSLHFFAVCSVHFVHIRFIDFAGNCHFARKVVRIRNNLSSLTKLASNIDKFISFLNDTCIYYEMRDIPAIFLGAQWLSDRVLDSRPRGRGFEPHRRHCVVVIEYWTRPCLTERLLTGRK